MVPGHPVVHFTSSTCTYVGRTVSWSRATTHSVCPSPSGITQDEHGNVDTPLKLVWMV